MAKIKSGRQIKLSGQDAENYLRDTGRASLPKTVDEFNCAMKDTADAWRSVDNPEAQLLAAVFDEVKEEPTS